MKIIKIKSLKIAFITIIIFWTTIILFLEFDYHSSSGIQKYMSDEALVTIDFPIIILKTKMLNYINKHIEFNNNGAYPLYFCIVFNLLIIHTIPFATATKGHTTVYFMNILNGLFLIISCAI